MTDPVTDDLEKLEKLAKLGQAPETDMIDGFSRDPEIIERERAAEERAKAQDPDGSNTMAKVAAMFQNTWLAPPGYLDSYQASDVIGMLHVKLCQKTQRKRWDRMGRCHRPRGSKDPAAYTTWVFPEAEVWRERHRRIAYREIEPMPNDPAFQYPLDARTKADVERRERGREYEQRVRKDPTPRARKRHVPRRKARRLAAEAAAQGEAPADKGDGDTDA